MLKLKAMRVFVRETWLRLRKRNFRYLHFYLHYKKNSKANLKYSNCLHWLKNQNNKIYPWTNWTFSATNFVPAALKPPSNLRYPRLADDLKLAVRYRSAMQRLMRESDKWPKVWGLKEIPKRGGGRYVRAVRGHGSANIISLPRVAERCSQT